MFFGRERRSMQLSIRLTPTEYRRLRRLAELHGVTMTDIVLKGLELAYQQSSSENDTLKDRSGPM